VAWYRLRVDWTWSTTSSATTALTAINATLAANGRTERAVQTGAQVAVILEPVAAAAAITLRNALTSNWATGTRTAGKASVVMRDESSA
jgi:hypothetical protein